MEIGNVSTDEIAIAVCDLQAIRSLDYACQQAGGGGYESAKKLTVEEFVEIYARNGIRFKYDGEGHMNSLEPLTLQEATSAANHAFLKISKQS